MAKDDSPRLFYEDKVTSFRDLAKRLRSLDQDAGVRLTGGSGKDRFFVFVTRFGRKYTMMTYAMGTGGAPQERLRTFEFGSPGAVEEALKKLVRGRLQAWVY